MNAKLAAWGTLMMAGEMTTAEYVQKLHELYLKNSDNERLLQLEMSTANEKDTLAALIAAADELNSEEKAQYAEIIFEPLKKAYLENKTPLAQFCDRAMRLWRAIPKTFADEEPFVLLTTAEDYLCAGSAVVARGYYDQAFSLKPVEEEVPVEQPSGVLEGMRAYWRQSLKKSFWGMMIAFVVVSALMCVIFGVSGSGDAVIEWFMEEKQGIYASAETFSGEGQMQLSGSGLFLNNIQACGAGTALGLIPFLYLPVFAMLVNAGIVGAAVGSMLGEGLSPIVALAALIPHGIFEIPAMVLSWALGFSLCRSVNRRIRRRRDVRPLWAIKQTALYFVLIVLPLVIFGALVESKVTPVILEWAMGL